MSRDWSDKEVEQTVRSYFSMLEQEITNRKYNKTSYRTQLLESLDNRTHGAVEKKHQNISAVLTELQMPSINGYKPLYNYQQLLVEKVNSFLTANKRFLDLFDQDVTASPQIIKEVDFEKVLVTPPLAEEKNKIRDITPSLSHKSTNYLEKEARNIAIGNAGEEFVIAYEKYRLSCAGKDHLADKIERVSETKGDSAGFDILSFEENGEDRYIETKTTQYGKSIPFFISPNELAFSDRHSKNYHLYRVFNFREKPEMYVLKGNMYLACDLEPTEYRARVK